jgi:hypothetical protein
MAVLLNTIYFGFLSATWQQRAKLIRFVLRQSARLTSQPRRVVVDTQAMSDDHLLSAYEEATTSIDKANEVILSLQPAIFRNGHTRFARGYSHFHGFAEHV